MPAVADRHVHIELSDPAAVLAGGVTAVRDLAWPPERIFALADASEMPSFDGPLIKAAGPMLTAPGGYPTQDSWAPAGTGRELTSAGGRHGGGGGARPARSGRDQGVVERGGRPDADGRRAVRDLRRGARRRPAGHRARPGGGPGRARAWGRGRRARAHPVDAALGRGDPDRGAPAADRVHARHPQLRSRHAGDPDRARQPPPVPRGRRHRSSTARTWATAPSRPASTREKHC